MKYKYRIVCRKEVYADHISLSGKATYKVRDAYTAQVSVKSFFSFMDVWSRVSEQSTFNTFTEALEAIRLRKIKDNAENSITIWNV